MWIILDYHSDSVMIVHLCGSVSDFQGHGLRDILKKFLFSAKSCIINNFLGHIVSEKH